MKSSTLINSDANDANLTALDGKYLSLDEWFAYIGQDRDMREQRLIVTAYKLAERLCSGRVRPTGESKISHVFTVVNSLAELRMDTNTLIAAILYELVAEGDLSAEEVAKQFGEEVTKLIHGVNHMSFISQLKGASAHEFLSPEEQADQTEKLRHMILAMVEDVRVMLIKLAERQYEMRTLRYLTDIQQRRLARETLEIFAPLANRLGIWQIKWELEDLSLRYLEPDTYQQIKRELDERRETRQQYIDKMIKFLEDILLENNIPAKITGRPKHIYSIWHKMQKKKLPFHDLHDVLAVRVMVNTVTECYIALGFIHAKCPPLPGEFDDYIACPKPNDYRSLHTAVVGTDHQTFEVQIRTHEMHYNSELGIASHWRYKEGLKQEERQSYESKVRWLRQVMNWQDEEGSANDFIERFKSELFEDRVYAFTPKGKIIDLEADSTPLDFAFYIHTDLGLHCQAASVNGRVVPLTYKLKTGDQVDIITDKNARPNRHWLNPQLGYVKTTRARNRLKEWLKQQDTTKHIAEGRSILGRELHRLNVSNMNLEEIAIQFGFKTLEDFLASIGRGETNNAQIAEVLAPRILPLDHPVMSLSSRGLKGKPTLYNSTEELLQNSYMANCCKPIPDDAVMGYITGLGVEIHRLDCETLAVLQTEADEECFVEVEWEPPAGTMYTVDIRIKADDRYGLLRDVSSILTEERINIIAVQTATDKEHIANMHMTVEIKDARQFSRALQRIDGLRNVMEACRVMTSGETPVN